MTVLAAAAPPINVGTVAADMANGVGGAVVSAAVTVWPVLVPALIALAIISGVVRKVGLGANRKVI